MRTVVRLLLLAVILLAGTCRSDAAGADRSYGSLSPAARLAPSLVWDERSGAQVVSLPLGVKSTAAVNPPSPKPRLDNLIVANLSSEEASVSFNSDLPASTEVFLPNPLMQFGSPMLTTDHRQPLSGLEPGTAYPLRVLAVSAALGVGTLPEALFTTAVPAQPGGGARVAAGVADLIDDPDDPNAVFVFVSYRNVGTDDAANVTLTSLNTPTGWRFNSPPVLPLSLGGLGRGASGVLMTRLVRADASPASPPAVSGQGTFVSGGQTQNFLVGGTIPLLYVTMTADQTTAHPGDLIGFTLTATNRGLGPATGVLLSVTLPTGLAFADASGGATPQNGTLIWTANTLQAGASGTVSFHARVAANVTVGVPIRSIAQARSSEIPNPVVSSTIIIAVNPPLPQLQLTKTADRPTVQPGQAISYTLTATNVAGGRATSVEILDTLPAGTTLQNFSAGGAVMNTATLRWSIGTLDVGQTATVSFSVQVPGAAAQGSSISNVAQLRSADLPNLVASNQGKPVVVTVVQPTPPPVTTPTPTPATPAPITFAGTWSSVAPGGAPPTQLQVSLTVDPQGRFTVWARSPDGQTVASSAQGAVRADGSLDVTSTDGLVHFTGQIAPDRHTAQVTAVRTGSPAFTVPLAKRPDLHPLPAALVGTFSGQGQTATGDRVQVRLSVDPGGNATLAAEVTLAGGASARDLVTLAVGTDGSLIASDGSRTVGTLQVVSNLLVITYTVQAAPAPGRAGFQANFQLPLQPFTGR